MKGIRWHGDARKVARSLPEKARLRLGLELENLQQGLLPCDWKPLKTVGPGVCEIRIHVDGAYRAVYVAEFDGEIHVLHVFQKKTRKTSRNDLELARRRYRALTSRN